MQTKQIYFPSLENVKAAAKNLEGVAYKTPLNENSNLSKQFDATILFKREDLQVVRSYKIRGAYNKMSSLDAVQKNVELSVQVQEITHKGLLCPASC